MRGSMRMARLPFRKLAPASSRSNSQASMRMSQVSGCKWLTGPSAPCGSHRFGSEPQGADGPVSHLHPLTCDIRIEACELERELAGASFRNGNRAIRIEPRITGDYGPTARQEVELVKRQASARGFEGELAGLEIAGTVRIGAMEGYLRCTGVEPGVGDGDKPVQVVNVGRQPVERFIVERAIGHSNVGLDEGSRKGSCNLRRCGKRPRSRKILFVRKGQEILDAGVVEGYGGGECSTWIGSQISQRHHRGEGHAQAATNQVGVVDIERRVLNSDIRSQSVDCFLRVNEVRESDVPSDLRRVEGPINCPVERR